MIINIINLYLNILNIKKTSKGLKKICNKYLFSSSLYDINCILNIYGIQSKCYKIDPHSISSQFFPSISIWKDKYVILLEELKENFSILNEKGEKINIKKDFFIKYWDGIILKGFKNSDSVEPNYFDNIKQIQYRNIYFLIGFFLTLMSVLLGFLTNDIFHQFKFIILWISYLISTLASLLIVMNDFEKYKKITKKICKFANSDCNNSAHYNFDSILGIKLSIICFSFFLSNLIFILFADTSVLICLSYFCFIAFLFTLWSLIIQFVVIKVFCIYCLTIDICIWIQFIILHNFILKDLLNLQILLLISTLYALLIILFNYIYRKYKNFNLVEKEIFENNRFIIENDNLKKIFVNKPLSDLKEIYKCSLRFGKINNDKNILLISNPFCLPCSRIHQSLNSLLCNGWTIYIIFNCFNEKLNIVNKNFIEMYNKYGSTKSWHLLSCWYKYGVKNYKKFFIDINIDYDSIVNNDVLNIQSNWIKDNKISYTPFILINGNIMPHNFDLTLLLYY